MRGQILNLWRTAQALSLLSMLTFSSVALAQAPLQLVDANATVLGPIVGPRFDSSSNVNGYFFLYDQGGQSALLVVETPDRIVGQRSGIYLYYTSVACDNTPAVATMIDCCAPPLMSIVIPSLNQLWVIDQTATVSPLVTARRPIGSTQSLGVCEVFAPVNFNGHPVTLWGTLDMETPLLIERNPFLFGDDFSSGNPTAWSNY